MDLVAGVKAIYVLMAHTTKTGEPKLVREITYPATSRGIVSRIYTELAVIDVTKTGLRVREMAPGLTFDELQKKTGAPLQRG